MFSNILRIFKINFASFLMVLGPEQVTKIFLNYLRSSVTKFRGSRSKSMSPGSSVVQVIGVIGGAGHRGSSVVQVIGGNRWCKSPGSSVV